jgi:hypothetical protein
VLFGGRTNANVDGATIHDLDANSLTASIFERHHLADALARGVDGETTQSRWQPST